jgi:hypothetical protein
MIHWASVACFRLFNVRYLYKPIRLLGFHYLENSRTDGFAMKKGSHAEIALTIDRFAPACYTSGS